MFVILLSLYILGVLIGTVIAGYIYSNYYMGNDVDFFTIAAFACTFWPITLILIPIIWIFKKLFELGENI